MKKMNQKDMWHCDICDKTMLRKTRNKHLQSQKHKLKSLQTNNNIPSNPPKEDPPKIIKNFSLLNKAFKGHDHSYAAHDHIINKVEDPFQYLTDNKEDIESILLTELNRHNNIKFNVVLQVQFTKDDGKESSLRIY